MYKVSVDEAKLQEIVRQIVAAVDPDKVILFGSRARGDFHEQSDVDLMIIKATDVPQSRRTGHLYQIVDWMGVPKDILWYTPEEVDYWSEVKYHVATRATREGRVLYERH